MWTDPLPEVRTRIASREFDAALGLARAAVAAAEAEFGAKHDNTALARMALGEALLASGYAGEAIPELQHASKTLGREGALARVAMTEALDALGLAHAARGHARDAEAAFCRAVEYRERDLGLDHPAVALALMRLAHFYSDGHFEDARAEPLLRRAVAILRRTPGTPDDRARALGAYAEVLMDRGADDEAEPLLREQVEIARARADAAPTAVAAPLHALATLLARRGHFVQAETLLNEAMTLAADGGEPTEASVRYETDLADVYRQMNQPDKALAHYRHALDQRRELEGPDSVDAAELASRIDELSRPRGHQFG
jgi:tetratricopeptide (TPR) repeat protein